MDTYKKSTSFPCGDTARGFATSADHSPSSVSKVGGPSSWDANIPKMNATEGKGSSSQHGPYGSDK